MHNVLQSVIFYPASGPFGRFYMAPDWRFVGLKKNRLAAGYGYSLGLARP